MENFIRMLANTVFYFFPFLSLKEKQIKIGKGITRMIEDIEHVLYWEQTRIIFSLKRM